MSYEILVRLHLVSGTVALIAFWLQAVARKGGRVHRVVGRLYAGALGVAVMTAVPMTVALSRGGNWGGGLLLAFLAWITVSAGVGGWLAAHWKDDRIAVQQRFSRAASWILLAISVVLLGLTPLGGALTAGLGGFGLWAAVAELRTPPEAPVWRSWVARHLEGMVGTGIAVHAAFLAFGLRRLLGASYTNLHFLLAFSIPTVVGIVAASWLSTRYGPPRETKPQRARSRAD